MRVKICGITNLEDAFCAIENGADALGFVFYEKSPRYITPKNARDLISKLPPFVEKVGLFVDSSSQFVNQTMKECGLTLAQIHFSPEEDFFKELDCNFIRVIRAKTPEDLKLYPNEYRLVDAFVEEYGGMGKRVPIEWFENIDCSKIILAGGLNEENVKDLKSFGFYGFDVSSAVEKKKGKKDCGKIKKFVKFSKETL
ncbi:MAG: phosphoribosylanthranilate isomerase [Campylobacterales bacterium]|nr:phosphoribosylanthranilate isomerase [Campylobacterales bacterium]